MKPELLIELYKSAVELYRHEDQLNWKKINMLLSANSLLFIAWGLIEKQHNSDLIALISLLGAIFSLGFFVTVLFGVIYLQHRKNKVAAIEAAMHDDDELRIFAHKKSYMRISPTTIVIVCLPLLFFCFWMLVFFKG